MVKSNCRWCGKEIVRGGFKPGQFCGRTCKGEWQRTQKPVGREWLHQKYVVEGLSTYAIGKLVRRDPKRVHEWLLDFGIPTRERGWSNVPDDTCPYQQREWLEREYTEKGRSAKEIADQFGVVEQNILHFLRKFGIRRRTMSETRKRKYWGVPGKRNGMYGKRGEQVPNWKGGATPERQAFYSSGEWKEAVKAVWKRDRGTCQRCGKKSKGKQDKFHIHHIVSFAYKPLRADVKNLVLLCNDCHHWVHSKANVNREFRRQLRVQPKLF